MCIAKGVRSSMIWGSQAGIRQLMFHGPSGLMDQTAPFILMLCRAVLCCARCQDGPCRVLHRGPRQWTIPLTSIIDLLLCPAVAHSAVLCCAGG
jgi:hypothetical protein